MPGGTGILGRQVWVGVAFPLIDLTGISCCDGLGGHSQAMHLQWLDKPTALPSGANDSPGDGVAA